MISRLPYLPVLPRWWSSGPNWPRWRVAAVAWRLTAILAKLQNQLNALPLTHCVARCVVGVKTVPHTVTGASSVPLRLKKKVQITFVGSVRFFPNLPLLFLIELSNFSSSFLFAFKINAARFSWCGRSEECAREDFFGGFRRRRTAEVKTDKFRSEFL